MLRNRLYYRLKPLLPASFRLAMRRWIAQRQRRDAEHLWPILPGSETAPEGWNGWPDGKQFALALSHDVEGRAGYDRCRNLMRLEAGLGLRSSFNFIPESGDYELAPDLRQELQDGGFEVGVHDLHHDGNLYASRRDFSRKAARINEYLKNWGAVGFRSGFMLHNLDWLHDLEIQYDASTFDTDPFEPQPDGRGTIFPFWVERLQESRETFANSVPSGLSSPSPGSREGYVELPYTLPQDSTMFLILRERSIDLWKRKVDWIVAHGGLLLVDTHPDYMKFNGVPQSREQYPADFYRDLLLYVQQKYAGKFWHALPKEVANWYRTTQVEAATPAYDFSSRGQRLKGRKAAVVLYSYYPSDPRPRRAAEALTRAGMEVDLLCLRQKESEPTQEVINGVQVHRVPMRRRRDSKLTYLLQYGTFIAICTAKLAFRSLRKRYDLVHVHNMPDVLVFSAIVPRLRGARVILDQHDPMPELMRTIFGLEEQSFGVRLLKFFEKLSLGFASQVITVNLACKKIFSARSCPAEKIQVVMNSPDERIFAFTPAEAPVPRDSAKPFVLMYHGSIVERHGLDLAVQAVKQLQSRIPRLELRIYGNSTPFLETVLQSVEKSGLQNAVRYLGPKSLEDIALAIRQSDLGVIPNRRSVFTEINTPTRIFEYLALGKPVIAPHVSGITDYFGANDLLYFKLGDASDLARQIEHAFQNPDAIAATVVRGQAIYQEHCWNHERQKFVRHVGRLLERIPPGTRATLAAEPAH